MFRSESTGAVTSDRAYATTAQQAIWFLHRMNPASSAYNLVESFRLRGPLERAPLEAALNLLVGRHESLRSRFTEVDGRLCRLVDSVTYRNIEYLDIGASESEHGPERTASLDDLLESIATRSDPRSRRHRSRAHP